MSTQQIHWDIGTGYDMFISLVTLHDPKNYGLRAAWAAGVRSRIPSAERETLDELKHTTLVYPPFHWLRNLEDPRDGEVVINALEDLSPRDRIGALMLNPAENPDVYKTMESVFENGEYTDDHIDLLQSHLKDDGRPKSKKDIESFLTPLIRADEYGERLLSALTAYYDVFFAEEERRIIPALKSGLEYAQELAQRISVPEMIEELSQGVSVPVEEFRQITFVPSYWATPFVWFGRVEPAHVMVAFGARPANASLVPGEVVPDSLVQSLKALSDPTRLRILHYLTHDPLTPTQLANKLRLRPPTVVHHLKNLRLAGLVRVRYTEGKEKIYTARNEQVENTFAILRNFIAEGGSDLTLEDHEEAVAEK